MATVAELEARNEIMARRLEELEQQLSKAERLAAKNETRAMQAEGDAERAAIESHLRIAALEAGSTQEPTSGSPEGPLDAVVRRAMIEATWKIDSQGKIYRVGADGEPVMTAGGYARPAALMRELRQTMPGAFPKHQDAGAGSATGANGIPAAGVNFWTKADWNLTKQGEYMDKHGKDAAEAMAAAAGVSVYSTHPKEV